MSPLKNGRNVTQIKKNISKLKLKKDIKRVSPMVSATFYNDGDIKIGTNKKFWKVKKGKWYEIKESIVQKTVVLNTTNKKHLKILYNTPFIAMHNTEPVFIKSIRKKSTDNYTVELLMSDKLISIE